MFGQCLGAAHPLDAVKKNKKSLPLPYASLQIVERRCDVALNGCGRSCGALVTGDDLRRCCALRCPCARFFGRARNHAVSDCGALKRVYGLVSDGLATFRCWRGCG